MLVKDFRVGETIEFSHERTGLRFTMRLEAKCTDLVRLVFDAPRDIIIRAIGRATRSTYGLRGGDDSRLERIAV